ncbi:MAG: DUF4160 domain-containing protein [Chlorobiaceae bacterium]|nr:DUF4160 domain-containing protein [Chlorobiaceae bacterium]
MPLICEFLGIKIYMYWQEHNPPRFHAEYNGLHAEIDIYNSVIFKGALPLKQLKLVLAWCELHREELIMNWHKAENHGKLIKIKPLQ